MMRTNLSNRVFFQFRDSFHQCTHMESKELVRVPRRHNARGLQTHYVIAEPPCVDRKCLTCASQKCYPCIKAPQVRSLKPTQNQNRFTTAWRRLRGHCVASTLNYNWALSINCFINSLCALHPHRLWWCTWWLVQAASPGPSQAYLTLGLG